MRSPPMPTPPTTQHQQQQHRLDALDNFNDFISSDSSAETASDDELDEFEPPSGERLRRVVPLQNGMASRPRRLARLCHSVASPQQPQLRKSPRKKLSSLANGNTTSSSAVRTPKNGGGKQKKSLLTIEGTAATAAGTSSASNTTAPKRAASKRGGVSRDKSSDSSSSSTDSSSASSPSSMSSSSIALNDPPPAVDGGSSSATLGRSRGGGRLSASLLQTDDGDWSPPPQRSSAFASRSGSSRRGGGLAKRSRGGGPTGLAKVPPMMMGASGRAGGAGRRGGGGRQRRGGRRAGGFVPADNGRGTGEQRQQQRVVHSSSGESSSSTSSENEEDNQSGNNSKTIDAKTLAQPKNAEEDDFSLGSSSSSSSSAISDNGEEQQQKERGTAAESLNSLALLLPSPAAVLKPDQQRRPKIGPLISAPLTRSSRSRRKLGTEHLQKSAKWTEQQRRPQIPLPKEFDWTNPYETCPVECMDPYQRKMREAFILYRFLGDYSPVLRSFMQRNLFYLRCERPPLENFNFPNAQNVFVDGGEQPTHVKPFHHHHSVHPSPMDFTRTNSRISTKFPTTIRPTFIRNNLFFGQKKATVQCFHVSECNGRLSSMRNIPSATFQMKVNERIRNIAIDLPDELHADVLHGDRAKCEYLVVRVVFHFEDAEIGGRHLRKVPSRQSSGGGGVSSDSSNQQQQQHQLHCLRKNGPADACDVVMFGAKRIFSFKPDGDLKVINDEASIALFSAAQLHFELNCLKLTAGQLSRLIHGNLKPLDGGSSPFITVHSHGDSDDEDDDDEEEEQEDNEDEEEDEHDDGGRRVNYVGHPPNGPKLKRAKVGDNTNNKADGERQNVSREGLSLREALEAMDMVDNNGQKMMTNGGGPNTVGTRNELLKLPKVIGLKFWLHSPAVARAAGPSSAAPPQLPPGSPPGQQRRRLFFRTAAANANASFGGCCSSDAPQQRASVGDHWDAASSCSPSSKGSSSFSSSFHSPSNNALLLPATPPLPLHASPSTSSPTVAVSPPFVCRPFPSSRCFFCLASLRVRNLWALQKHLMFCHPRFDFCFEASIRVSSTQCLSGFSISQNVKYDASNELPSVRAAVRPTWLVTKALAKEMRRVDNFPIERYTAVGSKQNTAEEYIRLKGRFNFEPPARIDQLWMRQMGSRKLNDITDLHPAECAMMQMWNTFLLRIRITLFGHRMLYKALRVFIKYHWHDIDARHLRTHFLLHLTCLLNAGGIDEEERYDLYRRMDKEYDPCEDSQHVVGREMKALRRELLTMHTSITAAQQHHHHHVQAVDGGGGGTDSGANRTGKLRRSGGDQHIHHPGGRMKLRPAPPASHHQQNNSTTNRLNGALKKTVVAATAGGGGGVELLQQPHPRLLSSPPLPVAAVPSSSPSAASFAPASGCVHFSSCQTLRERFPFASSKRIALLWKFLQDYDFPTAYTDLKQ